MGGGDQEHFLTPGWGLAAAINFPARLLLIAMVFAMLPMFAPKVLVVKLLSIPSNTPAPKPATKLDVASMKL